MTKPKTDAVVAGLDGELTAWTLGADGLRSGEHPGTFNATTAGIAVTAAVLWWATAHGLVPGRRHGRSRADSAYHSSTGRSNAFTPTP